VLNSPEPDYRRVLRETDAKLKAVAGRIQTLSILLKDTPVETTVGSDWQDLEGMPGCQARLVPGAFVMEARYEEGAELSDFSVEQAVYGQVTTGRFQLRRPETGTEPVTYEAGQLFHLAPNEPHGWRAESPTVNIIAFVPTTGCTS
jgi:hypothetical protein